MNLEQFIKCKIPVVEIFTSISGEGISAGEVLTFVRVAGCNLRCSYCDTTYSYDESANENEFLTGEEIVKRLVEIGAVKLLCTGGEPLETKKAKRYLPLYLAREGFDVRIETNGSCPVYSKEEIATFTDKEVFPLHYVLDVKCPGSLMHEYNIFEENFSKLRLGDEIKFVVACQEDIDYALAVIDKYKFIFSTNEVIINFSPVFKSIETSDIVTMLVEKNSYFMTEGLSVRLSLQIHKVIWPPEMRGV
ncbi:MAG: radical SAM protein [Clostridiaceae bacterium]|nr:radical SAM protein [Clostridiaceae bacterium]